MQTTFEKVEKWFQFPEKISFLVNVNGKQLTASLLSALYQQVDGYIFRICFSDGHEDGYSIQDWKIYTVADKSDPYCKALEREIHTALFSWKESKPLGCVTIEVEAEDVNAWIIYNNRGESIPSFEIFIMNSSQLIISKRGTELKVEKTKGGLRIRKPAMDKIKTAINKLLAAN
jgi:hypothetical protein